MCQACKFYETLSPVPSGAPKAVEDGRRTITGYWDADDVRVVAGYCKHLSEDDVSAIVACIRAPRIPEVAAIALMIDRHICGDYTSVPGAPHRAAIAPLSLLFWSNRMCAPLRVKSPETELLHGAMEKLALRSAGVASLNTLLSERWGLRLSFFCSCGVVIDQPEEGRSNLDRSSYYREREEIGRTLDSDVLGDNVRWIDSIAQVPDSILAASADVGTAEVALYCRLWAAAHACLERNPVAVDVHAHDARARTFLLGGQSVSLTAA